MPQPTQHFRSRHSLAPPQEHVCDVDGAQTPKWIAHHSDERTSSSQYRAWAGRVFYNSLGHHADLIAAPVADPEGEWTEVPLGAGPTENASSIGLADLNIGLCSGELAQHVLEVMVALDRSAEARTQTEIDYRLDCPAPLAAAT